MRKYCIYTYCRLIDNLRKRVGMNRIFPPSGKTASQAGRPGCFSIFYLGLGPLKSLKAALPALNAALPDLGKGVHPSFFLRIYVLLVLSNVLLHH